jgi:hypothetical protein
MFKSTDSLCTRLTNFKSSGAVLSIQPWRIYV